MGMVRATNMHRMAESSFGLKLSEVEIQYTMRVLNLVTSRE